MKVTDAYSVLKKLQPYSVAKFRIVEGREGFGFLCDIVLNSVVVAHCEDRGDGAAPRLRPRYGHADSRSMGLRLKMQSLLAEFVPDQRGDPNGDRVDEAFIYLVGDAWDTVSLVREMVRQSKMEFAWCHPAFGDGELRFRTGSDTPEVRKVLEKQNPGAVWVSDLERELRVQP